jgi:hypothetical protein
MDACTAMAMCFILNIERICQMKNKNIVIGLANRKCLICNYEGQMKTWLSNYGAPLFTSIILLFLWVIPGLLFIGFNWKKYKCPQCGALAKNIAIGGVE